jgi:hypothetical protein
LILYDDGSHGDSAPNDGNYTNSCYLLSEGNYVITAHASGTIAGQAFERMDVITLSATSNLDLNYDHIINFAEFTYLAARWLDSNCSPFDRCGNTDLDMSGKVDIFDMGVLAEHWLEGTTP